MNKLTETDKAYLAGLIDGEGCIYIAVRKDRHFKMMVIISGTIHHHIETVAEIAGVGSTHHQAGNGNKADQTQWHISSREALGLLKAILPYLILKKEQAKLAIHFQEHINNSLGYNNRHPVPRAVIDYRLRLANLLKEMKLNGKTFNEDETAKAYLPKQEYKQVQLI